MFFKKKDPDIPKTKEELMKLVKKTKKKFGINPPPDPEDSLQQLRQILDNIKKIGPERISDKIDAYLAEQKKKSN